MPDAKELNMGAKARRILSMDQFRGYAILGMIFVNFAGSYDRAPWMLHHHREGMSYNDTIAPIFMFVVGMGFRLSLMRRIEREGLRAARIGTMKRYGFLAILGFAIYQGYLWDALSDIGLAGLLALLFIDKSPRVRTAVAFAYLAFYQAMFSLTPYGPWVMSEACNGGPLGPFSWCFTLLMGTVGYDLLASGDSRKIIGGTIAWGLGLCAAGWALKFAWPGLKAEWPFTQYGMSAPYPLYATGLCFLNLLAFYLLCDRARVNLPHLTTLGENPLVIYLAQLLLNALAPMVVPPSAPLSRMAVAFVGVYGLCYSLAWTLHWKKIIVKV